MRCSRRGSPRTPTTLAVAVAVQLGLVTPLASQTVVGRLVRPSGSPVAGVRVSLLDADLAPVVDAVTDSTGVFVLSAGAAGTYVVTVQGEGLAARLSNPFALDGDGFYEERIVVDGLRGGTAATATPDGLSIRRDHVLAVCDARRVSREAGWGVLIGAVREARSGRTVPGARVVVEWSNGGWDGRGRREFAVGEEGLFVLCDVPPGRSVWLRASGPGGSSDPASVVVERGSVHEVDLRLPLPVPVAPNPTAEAGSVLGRVSDYATGEPVEAAEVSLSAVDAEAVTDANGRFVLESVPAGSRVLSVHHVAYPRQEMILPVQAGSAHDVDIRMVPEAVPVAPLRVSIRSTRWFRDMKGFVERARMGRGYFFPPEEVRRRSPGSLLDLVGTVPGMTVRSGPTLEDVRVAVRGHRC
ncbi:MAG: carboxypeptidase regulatory-like domain-containing protein, partial [Gemmatimonadota bacterium]